mmetsp:Transcript_10385/g.26880  ORF Transcript_10385/g.26880 Transcript_10385/m.26880 type:complete len:209 (+) Transcript_10385:291-917(+)
MRAPTVGCARYSHASCATPVHRHLLTAVGMEALDCTHTTASQYPCVNRRISRVLGMASAAVLVHNQQRARSEARPSPGKRLLAAVLVACGLVENLLWERAGHGAQPPPASLGREPSVLYNGKKLRQRCWCPISPEPGSTVDRALSLQGLYDVAPRAVRQNGKRLIWACVWQRQLEGCGDIAQARSAACSSSHMAAAVPAATRSARWDT